MKNSKPKTKLPDLSPLLSAGNRLRDDLQKLDDWARNAREPTQTSVMLFMRAGISAVELEGELRKLGCEPSLECSALQGSADQVIAIHALWDASVSIRRANLFWKEGPIEPVPDFSSYRELLMAAIDLLRNAIPCAPAPPSCMDRETKDPDRDPEKRDDQGERISPRASWAYSLFEEALRRKPELALKTDREVHDYISKHILDDGETLPPLGTFTRYLRKVRAAKGTQKHLPRAGRTGKSTRSQDQL